MPAAAAALHRSARRLRALLVLAAAGLVALAVWVLPGPPPRAVPGPNHVLIIGIDGLTARAMFAGDTPTLDRLAREGAWAGAARAVMPTMSAPNWASILMGAGPERHGIRRNAWRPGDWDDVALCGAPVGAGWPTLFDVLAAQDAEAQAVVFHDWVGIARYLKPGSAAPLRYVPDPDRVTTLAARRLRRNPPRLMFVHLDQVDAAGHATGFDSDGYRAAVREADAQVARMVAALARHPEALVAILSDHGGRGRVHGGDSPEEVLVNWTLWGHGIAPGTALDDVSLTDTAPTLAHAMGLAAPACWTGRVQRAAFSE